MATWEFKTVVSQSNCFYSEAEVNVSSATPFGKKLLLRMRHVTIFELVGGRGGPQKIFTLKIVPGQQKKHKPS